MNVTVTYPDYPNDLANSLVAQPRFYRFSVGALECIVLSDGGIPVPRPVLAGTPTEVLPDAPEFTLLPLAALLVRLPETGQLILVDTGFGADPVLRGRKVMTAAKLFESLVLAGISPAEVDVVVISHMHPDHIGGMFTQDGLKRFPNADYYVGAEELEFWSRRPLDFSDVSSPVLIRIQMTEYSERMISCAGGSLKTFVAGEDILKGVGTLLLPGHAPGQVGYVFKSRGQNLLYTADAFSYPMQSIQTPHVVNPYDMNSNVAIETRHRLLRLLAQRGWQSFTPHFPWPNVGQVVEADNSYHWEAVAYE